ncbi:hypothetical protein [Desulfovulcanus sp.]
MLKSRKFMVISRWLTLVAVIAITAWWVNDARDKASNIRQARLQPIKIKKINLPPESTMKRLRSILVTVNNLPEQKPEIKEIKKTLFFENNPVLTDSKQWANLKISTIFISPKHRFAVINGQPFTIGDELEDGRKVVGISHRSITLAVAGSKEKILWMPPLKVELKKAAVRRTSGTKSASTSTQTSTSKLKKKVKTNSVNPKEITPEQALELIRQISAMK